MGLDVIPDEKLKNRPTTNVSKRMSYPVIQSKLDGTGGKGKNRGRYEESSLTPESTPYDHKVQKVLRQRRYTRRNNATLKEIYVQRLIQLGLTDYEGICETKHWGDMQVSDMCCILGRLFLYVVGVCLDTECYKALVLLYHPMHSYYHTYFITITLTMTFLWHTRTY